MLAANLRVTETRNGDGVDLDVLEGNDVMCTALSSPP